MVGSREICTYVGKWKDMYKKSEKQARVKRQDAGGQDQFGGAVPSQAQEKLRPLAGEEPLSQLMNCKAVLIYWTRQQLQVKQRGMNWSRPIPP